jgi:hypothetical protein
VHEWGRRGEWSTIGVVGPYTVYTGYTESLGWWAVVREKRHNTYAMAGRLRSSRMNEQVLEEGLRKGVDELRGEGAAVEDRKEQRYVARGHERYCMERI